jgi:hypothetical protein
MDTGIPPAVTFRRETLGSAPTYRVTSYPGLTNGWLNDSTWIGNFTINSTTGEGTHRLTIKDAQDKASNNLTTDSTFTFLIDTITPRARNINVPNIADSQGQTISLEVYDPGSSGINKVLTKITFPNATEANYTMNLSQSVKTTIGSDYVEVRTYYAIWPSSAFDVGSYTVTFIFNDSANNVNSSISVPFTVSADPSQTAGKIAFICRGAPVAGNTCNYGIEDEVISWLRSNGWTVNVAKYNTWTLAGLNANDLIVCSDNLYACVPTKNVSAAHKNGEPFVEISNVAQAPAALAFGYVSKREGSFNSVAIKDIYLTVADNITAGFFGNVSIFNTAKKIPSLNDMYFKPGAKDLASPGTILSRSTLFTVPKNSAHGSYAYVGWFYGATPSGWNPADLTADGSLILSRTLNWARCSNPLGC